MTAKRILKIDTIWIPDKFPNASTLIQDSLSSLHILHKIILYLKSLELCHSAFVAALGHEKTSKSIIVIQPTHTTDKKSTS